MTFSCHNKILFAFDHTINIISIVIISCKGYNFLEIFKRVNFIEADFLAVLCVLVLLYDARLNISSTDDLMFASVHTIGTGGKWIKVSCLNPLGMNNGGCGLCGAHSANPNGPVSKPAKKVFSQTSHLPTALPPR